MTCLHSACFESNAESLVDARTNCSLPSRALFQGAMPHLTTLLVEGNPLRT